MGTTHIKAPGKINLGLDIVGTRPDGYHLLETVFQTVPVYDIVTVSWQPQEKMEIALTCDLPEVPCDNRNIAWKAAERFCKTAGITGSVQIHLEKHIPTQAGMGGGSTDGAAVLTALQQLTGTTLTEAQLLELAVGLGADVPFFLYGGTAYAGGIGEELEQLPPLELPYLVIAKGKEGVSTKEAYGNIDRLENPVHPPVQQLRQAIKAGATAAEIAPLCGNLFEAAVSLPEVDMIRKIMLEHGALCSVMTGSGAAVFGIFATEEEAKHAIAALHTQVTVMGCVRCRA